MSEVKWIKITTNMFNDEKVKLIESMPEADAILVIWVKLLVQAGRTNANGYIFLNENVPYTDEMLATLFNRPLNTVRLALQTLDNFDMIEWNDDKGLYVNNWEKHQNSEGLERIKEQNKLRQQRHRDKQKALPSSTEDVTLPVTLHNGTDIELELDLELDKEKTSTAAVSNTPYKEIIEYLNESADRDYNHAAKQNQKLIKARWNEGYSLDDFKKVIDNKVAEWKDDAEMDKYLRPATLFAGKFDTYLNQRPKKKRSLGVTQ